MELRTALSIAVLAPPPRLMFATAGAPAAWSAVTQSTPAITPDQLPLPLQSGTRTATSETAFALVRAARRTTAELAVPKVDAAVDDVGLHTCTGAVVAEAAVEGERRLV